MTLPWELQWQCCSKAWSAMQVPWKGKLYTNTCKSYNIAYYHIFYDIFTYFDGFPNMFAYFRIISYIFLYSLISAAWHCHGVSRGCHVSAMVLPETKFKDPCSIQTIECISRQPCLNKNKIYQGSLMCRRGLY